MGRLHGAILSQGCERGPWLETAIRNPYLNEVMANTQPEARQAGVEIEVTPEMIEAGMRELVNFDQDHDSGYVFVRRVFISMDMVRRSQLAGDRISG